MSRLKGKSVLSGFASPQIRPDRKFKQENCAVTSGEPGLKIIVSGLTIHQVKEQAAAKSKTAWLHDLVAKLKKSRELMLVELPDLFHDQLEKLAERIHLLEKLMHALNLRDKDNKLVGEFLEYGLGIRLLEKEIELVWEGVVYKFYFIMTSCDRLIEKVKHLPDGDMRLGAIDMANGLFRALDQLDGLFSRLGPTLATVGNTLQTIKELASAKSETNWIFDLTVKLKKIEEHFSEVLDVCSDGLEKLKEFIRVLEKLEHELKLEPKENEKLREGLESEFSSMMTLCDQLNEKYEHLYNADEGLICEDDSSDSSDSSDSPDNSNTCCTLDMFLEACEMAVSFFEALDKLDERCSTLVSPERTVGNSGNGFETLDIGKEKVLKVDYNKNNVPTPTKDKENKVIKIKSHDKLIEQLEMAETSEIPVVMLFNAKRIKPSKEYLPKFYELPNQYRNFDRFDGDIKFLRVDVKQAATEFEVRAYPTVLVLMPDSCGLRVVGGMSIEETVIVPAFVKALKPCLDKLLWKGCRYI